MQTNTIFFKHANFSLFLLERRERVLLLMQNKFNLCTLMSLKINSLFFNAFYAVITYKLNSRNKKPIDNFVMCSLRSNTFKLTFSLALIFFVAIFQPSFLVTSQDFKTCTNVYTGLSIVFFFCSVGCSTFFMCFVVLL